MPRRLILSAAERKNLLDLPDSDDEMVRHYAFNESDLSLIRQRRTDANRLGAMPALTEKSYMPVGGLKLPWDEFYNIVINNKNFLSTA